MLVRCPHCRNAIEVVGDDELSLATCTSCGGALNLIPETQSYSPTTRTFGHFQILERRGVGAFGTVYKAKDTQLDRIVALKIPRRDQLEPAHVELFMREARAAAQLKHAGIVAVHEIGRQDDTLYIVSDFIDGVTLAERLTAGQLTPRQAAELMAQVAEALHHAHQSGIIHRDLKPSNIMIDGDGQTHLMDFGLAKREVGETTLTAEGQVLGTAAYMSPEQARGDSRNVDRRTDIYSLGVILYELLMGERPFRGSERMLLHQMIYSVPPRPRKRNKSIPRDLETICIKWMEKDRNLRYPTAQAVCADFRRYLAGEPIEGRRISLLQRSSRWISRHPFAALLGSSLGLPACILLIFALHSGFFGGFKRGRIRDVMAPQVTGRPSSAVEQDVLSGSIVEFGFEVVDDGQRASGVLFPQIKWGTQSQGEALLDEQPISAIKHRPQLSKSAVVFRESFDCELPVELTKNSGIVRIYVKATDRAGNSSGPIRVAEIHVRKRDEGGESPTNPMPDDPK